MTEQENNCYNLQIKRIHALLFQLGANAGSSAFFHTAYTVYLAMEDPERLILVTKCLYPMAAKAYQTNWRAVERSIRRTIRAVWLGNPELLRKIAGNRLYSRPAPSTFIALLCGYLVANEQEASL